MADKDKAFKKGKASCASKNAEGTPAYNTCMQELSRRIAPKGAKKHLKKDKKRDQKARTNWYESQLKK